MQLDKRTLAQLGVKAGTVSGIALAFLLSGTYVKVSIEVDTRDNVATVDGKSMELTAPVLRFENGN